ncbi:MAG: hypothetical protein JO027_11405 [Solirubrobacterales bacterium]|nr:hypothetical protein [Solirubrobacterales bacterium]
MALPRGNALGSLRRLRSPAWAAVLPGAIVIGTFAPLGAYSFALGLLVLGVMVTPPLAIVAALGVVRGPRAAPLVLLIAAGALVTFAGGPSRELSATVLTALGALALGAALARLIPGRWVLVGFACMCALDVALLAMGAGKSSALVFARAAAHVPGPMFDQARLGRVALDYPDLVLSAALGGFVAGQQGQRSAAALVTILAAMCMLLAPAHAMWPATVPVAMTLIALRTFGLPRTVKPLVPEAQPAPAV